MVVCSLLVVALALFPFVPFPCSLPVAAVWRISSGALLLAAIWLALRVARDWNAGLVPGSMALARFNIVGGAEPSAPANHLASLRSSKPDSACASAVPLAGGSLPREASPMGQSGLRKASVPGRWFAQRTAFWIGCALFASAPAADARVFVFGVDGGSWPRIDAGIAAGELPNFAALAARGVTAEMETVEPVISPTVWTSIATGRSPEAHGVTDFLRNRTHVRVPTVFERLAQSGRRVGLYDWLVTWPPRTFPHGFVIPDWLRRDDRVTPPDVFSRAGLAPYAYSMVGVRTLAEFDANARREVAEKPQRFLALADAFDLDVGAVSFYAADATGHRFWRAGFPDAFDSPRTTEEARFAGTIRETYRGIDAALGQVMASLGPDDTLVVVSDHGFEADPHPRRIWSLRLLEEAAALGLDPARDGFEIDGEFMAVVVRVLPGPAEKRERTVARLASVLASLRTPDGVPVLDLDVIPVADRPPENRGSLWQRFRAFGLRQILRYAFGVKLDRPAYAHLLARPNDAALTPLWPDGTLRVGDRSVPVSGLFRVDDFTGRHDPTAVFLAAGGPIARIPMRGRISVLDVAPLVFHLAGSPVPDDLERPVPVRLLDPAALRDRPVRSAPAEKLPGLPPEPGETAVDDAVLVERLRALGYVE